MLFFAAGYLIFWNCYSQYSRLKFYPCDKTRIPSADYHISKSRDSSLEFTYRHDPREFIVCGVELLVIEFSLTHLIPARITRVSQNRKIFRSLIKSPKPVTNLRCQTEAKWSTCRFYKMALVFRDLLKNNKKEYILVNDSLDFMLFRD